MQTNFLQMKPKYYSTYFENSCIIHLMYLEVRDSSNVPRRFVNQYIMIIMNNLLTFTDNGHYGCFMKTIMNDFLAFLDNGHYGCFMITIIKDLSTFLDTCIKSL